MVSFVIASNIPNPNFLLIPYLAELTIIFNFLLGRKSDYKVINIKLSPDHYNTKDKDNNLNSGETDFKGIEEFFLFNFLLAW